MMWLYGAICVGLGPANPLHLLPQGEETAGVEVGTKEEVSLRCARVGKS